MIRASAWDTGMGGRGIEGRGEATLHAARLRTCRCRARWMGMGMWMRDADACYAGSGRISAAPPHSSRAPFWAPVSEN